jgi:hypothetical protein
MKLDLRSHQWKAFLRNPMFAMNLGVRIFMVISFAYLAVVFIALGLVLDQMLLDFKLHSYAIDTFNFILVFLFLLDFLVKFFFKKNQSMQIAPYLTLPVKKNKLFDFLLRKEFSSFWNLYGLFLVVPFALKSITPIYGFLSAILYIAFFYLACLIISFLVNYINNLINRSNWYYAVPVVLVALPFVLLFGFHLSVGDYFVQFGDWIIQKNPFAWLSLILVFALFWFTNRRLMRDLVYQEMQGEKSGKVSTFSNLSFLDSFGQMGTLINLDIKLITRSKRLKQQFFMMLFFVVYVFYFLYGPTEVGQTFFFQIFFCIFLIGFSGLVMGQYLFTSESSYFDGLMTRNISFFTMLRGKYFLYSSVSLLFALILTIPVFHGKISPLLLISLFFFVIGFIYFLIFQNAVYNKSYFDPFDGSMMNWKGTSSSMMIITLMTMFIPVIGIMAINSIWGMNVACYVMLTLGVIFTLTSNIWLKWTYERFRKRRYVNMEGFRKS